MKKPSLAVENSPFNAEQVELLNRLLPTLTPRQLVWLEGYLAGVGSAAEPGEAAALPAPAAMVPAHAALEVTVLYGSQTGNAMRLAQQMSQRLGERGVKAVLSCMSEYKTSNLKKVKNLLVVVSTHGEGDPPDKARIFHEFLHGKRAPKLEGARYAVLGLGDRSYAKYCHMGKVFDQRLEELGATRLHPRVDCDVDYEEAAEGWMTGVLETLGREIESRAQIPSSSTAVMTGLPTAAAPAYGRTKPFLAEVLENLSLNGRGSDKETRHMRVSLAESGLSFEPGDSLGIWPENQPALVDDLIREMKWKPDELVPAGKEERPLHEALLKHYEITVLTKPLLEDAAPFSRDGLPTLVKEKPEEELRRYMKGRDLLDLVRDFALAGTPAKDFVRVLRKLPPRLYSIANSYRATPDEVDVAVAAVRYEAHCRPRLGTCSIYCAERVKPGDKLPVYVHSNPNFRLPPDPDRPMIMVGPGTGVAPFRAFIEEREELGAGGKNWLFFGDRRFRTDFLYQLDWLRWRKNGLLTRMDVAFSRDADEKVYVQHRMTENSRELFAWLQDGASFYVCGDEKRMAPDVHAALETIVQREGRTSPEEAKQYLAELQQQGRYQRDVY